MEMEQVCTDKNTSSNKSKIVQNEELKKQLLQHTKNRIVYINDHNNGKTLFRSKRFPAEFLEKLLSRPAVDRASFKPKVILNFMPIDEALVIFSKIQQFVTETTFEETICESIIAKINGVNMNIPMATAMYRVCTLYATHPFETVNEAVDAYCLHNEGRYQAWLTAVHELAGELSLSDEDIIRVYKNRGLFNLLDFDKMGKVYMNKYYSQDTLGNQVN
jgi:hypothetical protein